MAEEGAEMASSQCAAVVVAKAPKAAVRALSVAPSSSSLGAPSSSSSGALEPLSTGPSSLRSGGLALPPPVVEEAPAGTKRKKTAVKIEKVWKASNGETRPVLALCLPIEKKWYEKILEGSKRYEVRVVPKRGGKRLPTRLAQVKASDYVGFHYYRPMQVCCRVLSVKRFESVDRMLDSIPLEALVPGHSKTEALQIYQRLFPQGIDTTADIFCLELTSPQEFVALDQVTQQQ